MSGRIPGVVRVRGRLTALAGVLFLSGCALTGGLFGTVGPEYRAPQPAATQWHAPRAHGGDADALKSWWRRFDDPVLIELIDAAQKSSATLVQAAARIERARAEAVAAGVAGNPSLDAIAGVTRSAFSFGGPAAQRTQAQIGVQSSWEIDLFGALTRQRQQAQAALESSAAAWHDARVALAAETANAYVNFRACEMNVELARADGASRVETARVTDVAAGAGLQAPATAALARASAADAAATLSQRRAQCEIDIKGLVALTALDEAQLRARLARKPGEAPRMPRPAAFAVEAVPARVLSQRPDLAAAERDVAAASAAIGFAEAQRYPRLSLVGSITPTRSRLDGSPTINVLTWSIGPSLTVPVLDGGRRAANVEAARADYVAAEAVFQAKARQAVREVEEALVRIAAAGERMGEVRAAAAGYRQSLGAVQTRQRAGLAALAELEDARRIALAAEAAVVATEYEATAAWVALYRAVGGDWDARLEAPARGKE
ncbi:MAG: efflux transporter outer membrane subunit [Burkholderiales bacterium]|nr:efflux transporter outer membrane subunit [Burkholderiales bacterium]